uniref:FAD dependent oxidoreductase domain-containing protein n=1 Tax=Amphora coffeiformis TaxID=265554 RepID=A0A7S3L292_9STRA|mmetsp:Transcript_17400/g.32542  ORF Transcript_17400/g.32542 Transcript_17400/m.32542 type:complete len:866 (-) Transcript_17400:346-2943(-)
MYGRTSFCRVVSAIRRTVRRSSLFRRTTACSFSSSPLPDDGVNVAVVGGGIIGTSVAYHLAKLGVENVCLLERDKLTSGTTWHAAGLMNSYGSMSSTSTWCRKYTQELYRDILPKETGLDTGWMGIGFIELACDPDRLESFRRIAAFNRFLGVDVSEISADEAAEHFPLLETSDILAGFYVPTDGRANPTDATIALAKGARQRGVKILEDTPVVGVMTHRPKGGGVPAVSGVKLSDGTEIPANVVVNCTGMWARQFGEACGVYNLPNQAAEHYYLITENIPEVDPSWPVVEDAGNCVYIRPEGGGLMLGLFERDGAPWRPEGIPGDFSFGEIAPDWDRMMPYLEDAMSRVPIVQNYGIKSLFCGPESFTPDNNPMVGESPELRNFYVAAGLNSIGILTGGGLGHILARWIKERHAPDDIDVTAINVNRFHKHQSNKAYREKRVSESLGNTYKVHYPDHQLHTCRNVKLSALHERLADQGAYFRDVSGWESPAWYAPLGESPVVEQESFGRESWFPNWEAEHRSCREDVALFDMSFMSKFLVQGRDAGSFLNYLSTANVDSEEGRITYTQWLNERGYMEADLTVTKLSPSEFIVVATDTMHNHVLDHMRRRLTKDDHVTITDVTARYSQINLQGPKSRDLLQELTSVDLTNFSFRNVGEIDIGLARALCMRITYVGELGYELFIPVEQARHVYDEIVGIGSKYGLRHAGLRALGSLRLEKGFRDFGHDMDNTDTLLECGLGFTCDFDKEREFIGQSCVLDQKRVMQGQGGLRRRMASVLLNDPEPLMHHGEVLWRNGTPICDIRAASYGHTLGGAVGLAMLEGQDEGIKKSFIADAEWEVEIANQRYACEVSLAPFYDPKNSKVKD